MSQINLSTPVIKLHFIGTVYSKRLANLEIKTVKDLLYHIPNRYIDYSLISDISTAQPGEIVTIKGVILKSENIFTKNNKKIQKIKISDGTGEITAIWFNQPYLIKNLRKGDFISLAGKIEASGRDKILTSPEYELIKEKGNLTHTGRLVPIYPETSNVSSKWLRSRIKPLLETLLPTIEEFLPSEILKKYDLMGIKEAIEQVHFPDSLQKAELARKRLAFDELLLIQLQALERKSEWDKIQLSSPRIILKRKDLEKFYKLLPFELTSAQNRAVRELLEDLKKDKPMNRLLEGDVGSGKTVVAAFGMVAAAKNSLQSAIMAPTQILAMQHFQTLSNLLSPLNIKVKLIMGGEGGDNDFSSADVIIGTHSLLDKKVNFKKLGFIVIDEQHRFGVKQRSTLVKKGKSPHLLTMTATPIPRTIALTMYGDLNLSVLDQMPPNRSRITTWIVPQFKRAAAYNWIREQIQKTKSQVFIVCPLIDESQSETMQSVKSAKAEFEKLSKEIFPDLKLGLLHGRLKKQEKEQILKEFKESRIQILVSTPVVEVGIDIPNATIMVIEGAERFGLATLHQLRGRVGRGERKSYCLLFTQSSSKNVWRRLKAMEESKSGMELAEIDLRLRGPGEVYGFKQHGFPQLKVASFSDIKTIKQTKEAAIDLFPTLIKNKKIFQLIKTDFVLPN